MVVQIAPKGRMQRLVSRTEPSELVDDASVSSHL